MRRSRDQQSLSYPLRLPDEVQADALRLLDVSRAVINQVIMALWSHLDDFGARGDGPAYKQVEAMTAPPAFHGSRLWRCQAEMVGRLLRAQAERKKQFALILPILEQGMIQPQTESRRAGKNRKAIREALADLRKANEDGGNYAAALNIARLGAHLITHYLQTGRFSHASIADTAVKPLSYMGSGAVLRLPPPIPRGRLLYAGRRFINGWKRSVALCSSYPSETMFRLCG